VYIHSRAQSRKRKSVLNLGSFIPGAIPLGRGQGVIRAGLRIENGNPRSINNGETTVSNRGPCLICLVLFCLATNLCAENINATLDAQRENLLQNAASASSSCADGAQPEQERDMGRAAAQDILHRSLPWQGKQLNDYIDRLGKRMVNASGTCQLFRFQVLYSPQVNAQSIPGGYIFLNTGTITAAHDEAELAAILGHEIAHFNVSHRKCQAKESLAYRLFRGLGLASGSGVASPMGKSGSRFTRARLRREEEKEADRLAVVYLAKAGYDPQAAARMFGHLEESEAKAGTNPDGRLSSHPSSRERHLRAERIAASLAAFQPVIADTPEFEAARAEVLRYDAVYEAVTGESVSGPSRQPPKLIRRPGSGL